MTCKVRIDLSSTKETESFFFLLGLSDVLVSFTYLVFKFGRPSAFQEEKVYEVREGAVYGVRGGEPDTGILSY